MDAPRYIIVESPRCPACGSLDLHTYGSHKRKSEGVVIPGASYRQTICRGCGWKFTTIREGKRRKSSRKRENRIQNKTTSV